MEKTPCKYQKEGSNVSNPCSCCEIRKERGWHDYSKSIDGAAAEGSQKGLDERIGAPYMFLCFMPLASAAEPGRTKPLSTPSTRPRIIKQYILVLVMATSFTSGEPKDVFLCMQTVPGGKALDNLEAADRFWDKLCQSDSRTPPTVMSEVEAPFPSPNGIENFDIIVLGGTLGIFLATALQLNGIKVAVVERNRLMGREQEWNISRIDMQV